MTRLKSVVGIGLVGALVVCQAIVGAQSSRATESQFRAAQYKADVQGDLKGAIEDYRRIAGGSDRAVAAKALLQMARAYEKLGQPKARETYQVIVRDYADQPAVVAAARAKLGAGTVSAQDVSPRRVLDGGTANIESISSDGRLAVGNEGLGPQRSVVLRDVLSGQTRTLVAASPSGAAVGPVISNDGRRVAYSWNERVAGGFEQSLRVIGTEPGATPHVVLAQITVTWRPLGWSPDGKTILAMVLRFSAPTAGRLTSRELAWISVESKSTRIIQEDLATEPTPFFSDARVSPDGRFIAFSSKPRSDSPDRYLYAMDANGQHETAIVTAAGSRQNPVWTADGAHLLYVGPAPGGSALWSVGVRDGQVRGEPSIVQAGFTDTPIGMTTSGAFYSTRRAGGGAYAFIAQRNPAPGDRALTFPAISGRWSRDGRLAFVRPNGQGSGNGLIIREMSTGEERSYPRAGLSDQAPQWLNDGSGVIVVVNEQGTGFETGSPGNAFYRVDARSGAFQRLFARDANGRVRSGSSAISLDDKTLYLTVRSSAGPPWTGIVGVDLATATERPVVTFGGAGLPGGGSYPGLAMSPDGRTLAVMARVAGRAPTPARIFSVGIDGSNYREIVSSFSNPISNTLDKMRWTPDGLSIVFVAFDPANNWRLMRVPAEGGQAEFDGLDFGTLSPLLSGLRMSPGNFNSFDLSPDGTRAVISTTMMPTYELWALDNLLSMVK